MRGIRIFENRGKSFGDGGVPSRILPSPPPRGGLVLLEVPEEEVVEPHADDGPHRQEQGDDPDDDRRAPGVDTETIRVEVWVGVGVGGWVEGGCVRACEGLFLHILFGSCPWPWPTFMSMATAFCRGYQTGYHDELRAARVEIQTLVVV